MSEHRDCQGCGGQGGFPETTPKPDGGQVTVFRRCDDCQGKGCA